MHKVEIVLFTFLQELHVLIRVVFILEIPELPVLCTL